MLKFKDVLEVPRAIDPLDLNVEIPKEDAKTDVMNYVLRLRSKRQPILDRISLIGSDMISELDPSWSSIEAIAGYCFAWQDEEIAIGVRDIAPAILKKIEGIKKYIYLEQLVCAYRLLSTSDIAVLPETVQKLNELYADLLISNQRYYSMFEGGAIQVDLRIINMVNRADRKYPALFVDRMQFINNKELVMRGYIRAMAACRLLQPDQFEDLVSSTPTFWDRIKKVVPTADYLVNYALAIITASEVEVDWEGTGRVTMKHDILPSTKYNPELPEAPLYTA